MFNRSRQIQKVRKRKRLVAVGFCLVMVIGIKANGSQIWKKVVNSLEVSCPQNFEVCFSPDEPCDQKLIKFIQSAKKSIDVAIFDINLDKLVHELLVASRKIPVRVVVDIRQARGEHSLVSTLIKGGIVVKKGRQRGLMHNKFTIIDGQMIETGSFNYTNHASTSNNENQVYLTEPNVVDRYKKRFEKIWSEGVVIKPKSNDRPA